MAKKMLIDATHDEEVRVAIVDGNRLEEFDSETSTKRQIKGNIYLAKVVRIEPSLQAAFVEFGGNRHGFLPFGEIHPDYFRIPVSDRAASESEAKSIEEVSAPETSPKKRKSKKTSAKEAEPSLMAEEAGAHAESLSIPADDSEESGVDLVDEDELPRRPRNYHYKIQEVIKRRQIMLIQVVKEERGNKGAALTTYLSLPGRYCVLMPNAGHRGGGISRKINDGTDRRRLRDILRELEIPEGMSLIVRTAGQERNKLEIRRDFDYLLRLWEEIRETTLQSTAPASIYAEGDLIKRSIRDVYNRDIDQILVEGDEAYKAAKAFMKALIPSHTKKVQPYKDSIPLFYRHKVEEQIDAMMNPTAKLPSGGSIVINPTEAMVAVDVNSGQSTRERHIDETALKTNLEAADEIARQMRLRDLAGLVVIDFIDMNDQKHIQAVEKRLKEATRHDRARIQLGHISQFGLLELSRQRLRPSLMETNSSPCHHCRGTGLVRSVESMSLLVLRAIENEGIGGRSAEIVVTVPAGVDLYLLNQKRSCLTAVEGRYQMQVSVVRDDTMVSPDFRIDTFGSRKTPTNFPQLQPLPEPEPVEEESDVNPHDSSPETEKGENKAPSHTLQGEGGSRRRRRRRPFSKRRDQERSRNQDQGGYSSGDGQPFRTEDPNISIEEQIVTEIMGSVQKDKQTPETSLHKEGKWEAQVDASGSNTSGGDQPRRRRRRGRRNNQRHSQQQGAGGSESLSSAPPVPSQEERGAADSSKPLKVINGQKPEAREVTVPITSLPEGPESSSRKGTHGRWWKRLLES
ncbi:MAG: ribonuclease [Alphaproteobacteria bacterium]|jgi:ribonuclease E|nr:ribonuclease [Alphaproteobacteria bacterium]